MKKIFLVVVFLTALISCGEEESFHQIAQIEREVYLEINNYRTATGLETLVEQFLLFKEARLVSEKIAAGTYELNDPDAEKDLDELADNLGGTSHVLISFRVNEKNKEIIMNSLTGSPEYSANLLGEYSQCGVGISTDPDNNHYVVIMLVEIPD